MLRKLRVWLSLNFKLRQLKFIRKIKRKKREIHRIFEPREQKKVKTWKWNQNRRFKKVNFRCFCAYFTFSLIHDIWSKQFRFSTKYVLTSVSHYYLFIHQISHDCVLFSYLKMRNAYSILFRFRCNIGESVLQIQILGKKTSWFSKANWSVFVCETFWVGTASN